MFLQTFPEECDDCPGILLTICHAQDDLIARDKNNKLVAHLQIADDNERKAVFEELLRSFSGNQEVQMGDERRDMALQEYLCAIRAALQQV